MREKSLLTVACFLLLATIFGIIIYFKSGGVGFQNKLISPVNPTQPITQENEPAKDIRLTQSIENKAETIPGLTLIITEPTDKITVNNSQLTIKGKTTAKATVFVNDQEIEADDQGNFSILVTLDEGENVITIVASDDFGNYVEREITITLENLE